MLERFVMSPAGLALDRDGQRLLVASKGGAPTDAYWAMNVRASPCMRASWLVKSARVASAHR